ADVDGDGWLDLFVGREAITAASEGEVAPASMYVNQRDGTFVDVAVKMGGLPAGYVKGAVFGDLDGDLDPELYISTMQGKNQLVVNGGKGDLHLLTEGEPPLWPYNSFATWMFDYDQDGRLDIFAAAYPASYGSVGPLDPNFGQATQAYLASVFHQSEDAFETMKLYHNTPAGFVDVTAEVGLDDVHSTMGGGFGDLDMDGFPDIYLGTGGTSYDAIEPNIAYHNSGGVRFLDVTSSVGMGHLQKGHGVCFGDIDEDGDEDLWADIGGAFPGDRFGNALFLNPTEGRHSVHLRLEGTTANRSAIGAHVRIVTPGRTFHHWVGTGGSFGANSLQVEGALGDETEVVRVEIDWPYGETEVVDPIEIDAVTWIRQGEGAVRSRPLLRMPIAEGHDEG
ncbi:MAG TPA: CRTAC1 family protein, partial [Myxococcota bacterium]|nr:CRTAC1 family protein [Myxococcota bacterium]